MKQERGIRRPLAFVVALLALGCADSTDEASPPPGAETAAQQLPAGHVPLPQSETGTTEQEPLVVTVMETMDAGGYTYARVENEGSEMWAAGPPAEIEVGDVLLLWDAMPMENFSSGTLDRTFEVLYFVGEYQKQGEAVADVPSASGAVQGTAAQVLSGGGYTYVQVEVEGEELWLAGPMAEVSEGQTVSWRGGTTMVGFTSNTLERTFDEILFVEQISVVR